MTNLCRTVAVGFVISSLFLVGCWRGRTESRGRSENKADSSLRAGISLRMDKGDYTIEGVSLGMDSSQVRAQLGNPDAVYKVADTTGRDAPFCSWMYRDLQIMYGTSSSVEGIAALGPHVSTVRGLRVGDTKLRAQELYGNGHKEVDLSSVWDYFEADSKPLRGVGISFEEDTVEVIYLGRMQK